MMPNTPLHFHPPVLAHRGASAVAPENTLAAFKKAKDQGARWLEFDVMLAACGEVVVFHDETLDRTTNGQGLVSAQPYHYLKTLDAGSWFHPDFAGERIPRLSEVLDFLEQEQLSANIEIKSLPGQEQAVVTAVFRLLAVRKNLQPPLISSFSIPILRECRKQSAASMLGLLLDTLNFDWEKLYQDLACVSLHVDQALLNPTRVRQLKVRVPLLLAYTVNDRERADELQTLGVDAVFTDCPDKILALFIN